jgi:hypothetical protein
MDLTMAALTTLSSQLGESLLLVDIARQWCLHCLGHAQLQELQHDSIHAGLAHGIDSGCPDGLYSRIGEVLLLSQALAISSAQASKRALQLEICRLGAVALQAVCLFSQAASTQAAPRTSVGGASPALSEATEPSAALGELLQATVAFADMNAVAAGTVEEPDLPTQVAWLAASVGILDQTVRSAWMEITITVPLVLENESDLLHMWHVSHSGNKLRAPCLLQLHVFCLSSVICVLARPVMKKLFVAIDNCVRC